MVVQVWMISSSEKGRTLIGLKMRFSFPTEFVTWFFFSHITFFFQADSFVGNEEISPAPVLGLLRNQSFGDFPSH